MKTPVSVVWLKRDLRVQDHAPFFYAKKAGLPVIVIYVYEPSLIHHYDWDIRHGRFIHQSLEDLKTKIDLNISFEEVTHLLTKIDKKFEIRSLFSHEETGIELTYKRDLEVRQWSKDRGIQWREFQTNGIVRGLRDQRNWNKLWVSFMKRKCYTINPQELNCLKLEHQDLVQDFSLDLRSTPSDFSLGGEDRGWEKLSTFYSHFDFNKTTYTPGQGHYTTSHLAPYLSWGNLSLRQVYQEGEKLLGKGGDEKNIKQFLNRLKWRCSFGQRLEADTSLETKDHSKKFSHLRNKVDKTLLKAWKEGKTGYPLVDASMRCVNQTGYLNFRLRSLVVSFLTHHLWQPWQEGARYLSRQFLDYDPGVHYPQFQLQSGAAGEPVRIYDPIKQSKDKDFEADFIKKWVPELANLPTGFAFKPWELPSQLKEKLNFTPGVSYPDPVISIEESFKRARDKLK